MPPLLVPSPWSHYQHGSPCWEPPSYTCGWEDHHGSSKAEWSGKPMAWALWRNIHFVIWVLKNIVTLHDFFTILQHPGPRTEHQNLRIYHGHQPSEFSMEADCFFGQLKKKNVVGTQNFTCPTCWIFCSIPEVFGWFPSLISVGMPPWWAAFFNNFSLSMTQNPPSNWNCETNKKWSTHYSKL